MKFHSGPSFQVHVPCHPFGTDPSKSNKALGQPTPTRQTYSFSWVKKNNGSGQVGRMTGAIAAATASITCTQANVEAGRHLIRIGPYELRPAIDFDVGADDNALADNLAAAINALPGFSAPNPAANVVVLSTTLAHGDDTVIEIVEVSALSAFALAATNRPGYMDRGAPAPGAPLIS